jgi:phage gpG-like protein
MKPSEYFRKLQASLPKLERELAQKIIKGEAAKFVAENFEKEGFQDGGLQKWKPRKKTETATEGTRKSDGSKAGRALLVQTGKLKRQATHPKVVGNHVDFVFTLPYAEVHNEGLQAGRGAGFIMPKRQFIGRSKDLDARVEKKAIEFLNKKLDNL